MIHPARRALEGDGSRERDRGTTLIEMLVVTIIMGLVASVLAFSFIVIIRTTPGTEARTDDARTLLSVTTYLPQDVNSTPPNGFDFAPNATASGCLSAAGATNVNLVQMEWDELSTVYRVGYRYELVSGAVGAGREIVRYACTDGSGSLDRKRLTSELPNAFGSATVTPVVDTATGFDIGLQLEVDTVDGKLLTVNARSNDPDTTLPPIPPTVYPPIPPGNSAPTASAISTNTAPGVARNVALAGIDPDGDALVATLSGVPPLWTTSVSGLVVTVTPNNDPALIGTSRTFNYTVTDPYGQAATSTVTVNVVAIPTNSPPVAGDVTDSTTAGTPLIVNLPVSDPEADPLTITWAGVDPSLTVSVSGTVMTINSDGSTSSPGPFTYTASDGSLSDTGQVDITVVVCSVSSLTPSHDPIPRRNGNKRLVNDVVYTVAYTGPCNDLVLEYDHNLDDGTFDSTYLSFGSGFTVTLDGHPGGLTPWSLGLHDMRLRRGIGGPVVLTDQLEVIPQ